MPPLPKEQNDKQSFVKRSMNRIADKIVEFKGFARSSFSSAILFSITSREKLKNVVKVNLDLAALHFQNNRLTDAKLRYWIVTKLDKGNFDAIVGLGYINYIQKNYIIALSWFRQALEIKQTDDLTLLVQEIEQIHLQKDA